MAPGFSVYLDSLGRMATSMDGAADAYSDVAGIAGGDARIASNALGFFGGLCNFPAKYKAMCDNVHAGAIQTNRALSKAAEEFLALERQYAHREDFYAKKFHIQADHIKPKIPDLAGGASGKDNGGQLNNGNAAPAGPGTPTQPKRPTDTVAPVEI